MTIRIFPENSAIKYFIRLLQALHTFVIERSSFKIKDKKCSMNHTIIDVTLPCQGNIPYVYFAVFFSYMQNLEKDLFYSNLFYICLALLSG